MIPEKAVEAALSALGEAYGEDAYCKNREYVMTALEAAAPHMSRTIATVEELDALPFESVARDAEGYVLERWGEPEDHMWATPMNGAWIRSTEVTLPATVLHIGAAK